jgi:Ni,Fe-hydrogenase maturation factor
MPRGMLTRIDMLHKIYGLKKSLYENSDIFKNFSEEKKRGANEVLNRILDIINEYHQ